MILHDTCAAIEHFGRAVTGSNNIRFVAVGGPTAVGKSTLSRQFLAEAVRLGVPAFVLEGDRFLVPQKDRPHPASFPDDVYEIERLRTAVSAIADGQSFRAPFYERDGRHTGRFTVRPGEDASEILSLCHARACSDQNELVIDQEEVLEVVALRDGVWILDSELALLYEDFLPLYDLSYGLRASRSVRKSHFMHAVERGERYPYLTELEARAKIEGFWQTDDALIEPTVLRADVQIELAT